MKFALFPVAVFVTTLFVFSPQASAAPIGVPGATLGANQSTIGLELNLLVDRNLEGPGDTEGMALFAKGELGLTERVDLLYRFGFGRFEAGTKDSDLGPAFGFGTKVTWATIDNLNLKIGSVMQMTQIRADVNSTRGSFLEYDFALGAFLDSGSPDTSGKKPVLTTYGGLVFSSLDAGTKEESSVGVFAGLLIKLNKKMELGLELRLLEQTALGIYTSFAF